MSLAISWAPNASSAGQSNKNGLNYQYIIKRPPHKKGGKTIRATVLIEGIVIIVLGLISMAEGLRLITHKDPYVLYDSLGPGFYIFALSISLITVGIVHIIINYRKFPKMESVEISKEMKIQMLSTIMVLTIYVFLIGIVGYLVATLVFFFLEFRVVGIKSWRNNFILTLILTIAYYITFVKFCGMVFPEGIYFECIFT